MAVCINAARWTNGVHQLPDAIPGVQPFLFRYWFWYDRQITTLRNLLRGDRCMGDRNYMEPFMAALFPLWTIGMVVEKFDLLEKATIEKTKQYNTAEE
jgi:hypothetical protein